MQECAAGSDSTAPAPTDLPGLRTANGTLCTTPLEFQGQKSDGCVEFAGLSSPLCWVEDAGGNGSDWGR